MFLPSFLLCSFDVAKGLEDEAQEQAGAGCMAESARGLLGQGGEVWCATAQPGTSLAALGRWGSTASIQEPGQSKVDGRRGEHVPSPEEEQRNLSECSVTSFSYLPHERREGLSLAAKAWH